MHIYVCECEECMKLSVLSTVKKSQCNNYIMITILRIEYLNT